MEWPDGRTIMHARAPYDPVKAREYYLRTRRLKGRRRGSSEPEGGGTPKQRSNTFSVRLPNGRVTTLTSKELAEQRAYVARRVQEIERRLSELGRRLREQEARARRAERDARRPASASERRRAARESRKYRDKHKQRLANQRDANAARTRSTRNSGASLEQKVDNARRLLKAALLRQQALIGATRNG